MKMTKTFLSPMSPDGKAGEEFGIQFEDEAPKYLEPFAENDDAAKLRHDLHEARAKLQHAKSRGKGVAEAQKALEAAKSAVGKIHHDQAKAREQQRTGTDYGAPSPFSRDTRQFMEPVSYADNDYDGNDTTGRTFDDEQDDSLEARVLAAVTAIEQAQANGASWAEVLRLEEELRVLREQLPNPSAPQFQAPPRRSHITRPGPSQPTGQAAAPAVKNTRGGWVKFLAALDARLAKRTPQRATHSADVCCSGQYLCAKCQAKKAAGE